MLKPLLLVPFLLLAMIVRGQSVEIEHNKDTDLTPYKTFRFGEGEIITPKDKRQFVDSTVHGIIRRAIAKELMSKGVYQSDSAAAMTITYIAGVQQLTDAGRVGPLGLSPGNYDQTYSRDYQQGNLIIDLNDSRTNSLIWRVRGQTNMGGSLQSIVDRIVGNGLKKFSIAPTKKKRKKKS